MDTPPHTALRALEEPALQTALDRLLNQSARIQTEIAQYKTALAEKRSGFCVGDRITDAKGRTAVLTALEPTYGKTVRFRGTPIKKDGTPGPEIELIWRPFAKTQQ